MHFFSSLVVCLSPGLTASSACALQAPPPLDACAVRGLLRAWTRTYPLPGGGRSPQLLARGVFLHSQGRRTVRRGFYLIYLGVIRFQLIGVFHFLFFFFSLFPFLFFLFSNENVVLDNYLFFISSVAQDQRFERRCEGLCRHAPPFLRMDNGSHRRRRQCVPRRAESADA